MRKRLFWGVCFLLFGALLHAQNYTGARVAVLPVDLQNIGASESHLSGLVKTKLSANLQKYTGLLLIDTENESELRRLQKQSQTGSFDRDSAIQAGRLLSARYVIFSVIIKDGSKYNLSCTFTDIETGKTTPIMVTGTKSREELYSVAGCAVDKITIELCEQLGIFLSSAQKYVL